ncbi:Ribonuclease H-like protein [Cordyceps fumosorosea ARSEF 2679]|uniref:Ribonuclease H-like protein n=1 Tax=Cordyceps fumosorosea (strain ARSEF 2679) TaxID=1081104 RepID=A0A167EVG3_CORFA|nr:Ribonuclease H-like protein [Cordyceps fumosorosea ARSEF 2679]OAA44445.1 Ribonuclease H-like protein [Cordyceps fumosorosea ARSEF 2679]
MWYVELLNSNDFCEKLDRQKFASILVSLSQRDSGDRGMFDDCEVDLPSHRPQERVIPEHISGTYTRPGKPAGASAVADIGDDHRRYLRLCIINAWQKLNEYYIKLGESPLFAASVILHPGLGIRYLEINWATEEQLVWVRDAKTGLSRYIDKWYRPLVPHGSCETSTGGPATMLVAPDKPHEASDFRQWVMSRMSRATATGSELDRYMRLESQETDDPVRWWMAHQGSFPVLSQLALDVLAIPAMAADCERSFSLAKLSLTSQRLSMSSTTLEALQCLKNWTRHGAVKLGSARLHRGLSDGVCDVVHLPSI